MGSIGTIVFCVIVGLAALAAMSIKVLKEYERGVIFRLGRLAKGLYGGNGPGLVIIIPVIDRLVKVSLRLVTHDVPPQDVITRDNVSVKVNAVVYFRVIDPTHAVVEVADFLVATSQLAQTALRSVLGAAELDELLSNRDKINDQLRAIIDGQVKPWGIEVPIVEVKHVDLPQEMQRAMAKQAEAERERRAKIIAAEGEFQAAEKLGQAAAIISRDPVALQLRFLQTLAEVATENNSTTIFPVPIDLFRPFLEASRGKQADNEA
ncbi:slipin family protein [Planctomycetota bacterium]